MKRTMMTLAAMLLVTIGVFAQGATPLKGDVNGDGKVDVADITAIIQIMKNGGAEVAVTGITLDKSSLTLSANGTGTIKATVAPSNATSQGVNWTSDDPSTATVTALTVSGENATVTWKKAGTVTITAKAVGDDSKKATCSVTCLAEGVVVYYWYVGTEPITTSSTPGSGTVTTDETTLGWHNISGTPTEIQVGPTPRQSANVTWYIAIPNTLGITKATSGGLTDGGITSSTMTLSDGVVYRVFVTPEMKKVDYLMTK